MKTKSTETETRTKTAYLTIDDVPTDDLPNKINFLQRKKIKAILNVLGRTVNKSREPHLIEAIEKGFVLGNHSWNHKNFNELTEQQIEEEIIRTDKLIDDLYKKVNIDRPIKIFRFPYLQKGGKNKDYTQQLLKKLGYSQPNFTNLPRSWHQEGNEKDLDVFMTFDTYDWTVAEGSKINGISSLNDMLDRIKKLQNSKFNEIIMMHDDERIKEMFEPLIEKFIESGFNFKVPL